MIQTLGDILLLVLIVSIGVVSLLLTVLLYHLIFVVMDLRQVVKRCNTLTKEIEEMVLMPVEVVSRIMEWVEENVWEKHFTDRSGKREGKRKKKAKTSKEFKRKEMEG